MVWDKDKQEKMEVQPLRKITKIENTKLTPVKRKRVAAYARVSTGHEEQLHSLSAQISYYNSYIGSRGDWELVGIYTDTAMTGTKDNRPGLKKLIADCKSHKIDMVIVKSITRLARNTVILLDTVRKLKELGIDIYFEKENIHSLSSDGELMLTLLASFAQEESRSLSENVKWAVRKKFEQGQLFGGRDMLGYHIKDGTLHIIPEEAETVKQIYRDYLSGMGVGLIAKRLNQMDVKSKTGGLWHDNVVSRILRNERYTGDLLLQKTYHPDHISQKCTKNRGELPMYYVQDHHEAIIDRETFKKVQAEIARRKEKYHYGTPAMSKKPHLFTGLIRCGLCGKNFQRKVDDRGSNDARWICSTLKERGKKFCPSKQIPENILIDKTSEILGTTDWNRETLLGCLKEIRIPEHHQLVYIFQDRRKIQVSWQYPSRNKSWTKEMRKKAREEQMARIERRKK